MIKRTFHTDGTLPQMGEIFVFGSNLQGVHGAGAAKLALEQYGARMGFGKGLCGESYAIPTRRYDPKSRQVTSLSLMEIRSHVESFCITTTLWPTNSWWVTGVGCGRAGLHPSQMAPLFAEALNCSFPTEWMQYFK